MLKAPVQYILLDVKNVYKTYSTTHVRYVTRQGKRTILKDNLINFFHKITH